MASESATLPEYPVDALPDCIRPLVLDLADATGCSPSLPATLALGAMSGTAGSMAQLGKTPPHLWAVVKAHDSTPYDICKTVLLDPLHELADEVFGGTEIVFVEMWNDHDFLINRSPDASVSIQIHGPPKLCFQGLDTMSCVGRMDGEPWLQPTLWRKILCADCTGDLFGPPFPRCAQITAREAWLEGIRAVMVRRAQVAGQPLEFALGYNLEPFFDDGIDTDNGIRLALLLALFASPSGPGTTITDEQASSALKLIGWHDAAKRRLWQNAMAHPWGGAYYGKAGTESLPPRAWEIATRLQRREEGRVARSGVPACGLEGLYLFVPDPAGTPCGLEKFRQVHGPKLAPAELRKAINALEDLAAAANRIQMHYDHGIWGRACPHGLAAAVQDGKWSAIVVWQQLPPDQKGFETCVPIKNLWVSIEARRHRLATKLVALVGSYTKRSPLFEAPFTDNGKAFADRWYETNGGAPEGWQFGPFLDQA